MGLPSKQRTRTSKRDRASHFALKPATTGKCPACGATVQSHVACPACGAYRGRSVINVTKRVARKTKQSTPAS